MLPSEETESHASVIDNATNDPTPFSVKTGTGSHRSV